MKKSLFFICALFYATASFSQNTFPSSGNVGIGTQSPQSPLTVMGDIHSTGIIGGNGSFMNVLKIQPLESSPGYFYINTNLPANGTTAPQIQITGYMYTASNKAMKITIGWYHFQGNFYWSQWQSDIGYHKPSRVRLGTYLKNGSPFVRIEIANDSIYWSNYTVSSTDFGDIIYPAHSGWTYEVGEMPATTTSQIHIVNQYKNVNIDGNLGIGISSPTERLAVNGNIRAKEIKVEHANWPDYVFTKSYSLPSLQETEKHIKEKGHLPGIPSALEVRANGIDLGEMNAKLLQKIEELTLHLIEKETELNTQKNILTKQQMLLMKQQEQINSIMQKLK